ncbi:protein kinase C-like isoform X2 [Bacillus rossius redtenbacheri]|uniref:protein kinase C-like isoform X2 n=1 Tax=Bacillus rossius redtenbacheri TaxID=93214 RepID=UPI002FDD5089
MLKHYGHSLWDLLHDIAPGRLPVPGALIPQPFWVFSISAFSLVETDNVLVDGEGNVVQCSEPAEEGTTEYLAPEALLRTPPGCTAAVDCWGAGVLGFELLTGSLPFDPGDEGDLNIIHQEPHSPPCLSPEAAVLLRSQGRQHTWQRTAGLLSWNDTCRGSTSLRQTTSSPRPVRSLARRRQRREPAI